MHVTRRFAIAFGVLICAAVVVLVASRELRRTTAQELRALGFIAKNRPFGLDEIVNPTQPVLSRQVRRSWQWIAYEGIMWYDLPDRSQAIPLLEQAIEMAPASVHQPLLCRLAITTAGAMNLMRSEMFIGEAFPTRFSPPNLAMAAKTIRYASEAWKAEPDNALYPQLIAGAYLGQHRDMQALAMLERAARLRDWNDHRAEAEKICVEALLLAGGTRALSKMSALHLVPYAGYAVANYLAGIAGGLAYKARQAGDAALAARWYRAAYGMMDPIMRSAKSWAEIQAATVVPWQVLRPLAASVNMPRRRGRPWPGESVQPKVGDLLLLYNLYDYLNQHGERQLALRALVENARSEFGAGQMYLYLHQGEWDMWSTRGRLQFYWAGQVWVMLALLISVAATALVALVRMPRRLWQRLDDAVTPGLLAIRVILVAVPIIATALGLPMAVLLLREARGYVQILSPRTVGALEIVLLLFLLLAGTALVEAWRSRKATARETPFRARWMASIRMVLPRVVAVFLLVYLLMFIPMSIVGAELERQVDRVMREGDLPPRFHEQLFPPGLP